MILSLIRSMTLLAPLIVLLIAPPSLAQSESPRELAQRAGELVRAATALRASDPERADAKLREAVEIYLRLESTGTARSAALERTLGSASLMLGDTGRGVLHLRRAVRLDPTDAHARETLEYARSQVRSGAPPSPGSRVRDAVLWWRGYIPRPALLVGALLAWGGAWSLAIVRRLRRWERGGISIAVLLVAAGVGGGALASERMLDKASREAVLIEDATVAYNGPSRDVYPPTFTEPMRAGVELVVLDRRDGWAHVRLANDQETWVPETAVEMVAPEG